MLKNTENYYQGHCLNAYEIFGAHIGKERGKQGVRLDLRSITTLFPCQMFQPLICQIFLKNSHYEYPYQDISSSHTTYNISIIKDISDKKEYLFF